MSDSTTRDTVLRAALAAFTELGYERTTTADICSRACASNGSVFHHFKTKEGIAAALYVECIKRYQERMLAALRRKSKDARAGIATLIRAYLQWIEAHPDDARFLFNQGRPEWVPVESQDLKRANQTYTAAIAEWIEPEIAKGALRDTTPEVFMACLTGPAQVLARRWVLGVSERRPLAYTQDLAEAAWRALGNSASPTRNHALEENTVPFG